MLEEDIILNALNLAVSAAKNLKKKEGEIDLHPLYKDAVEMCESISYHAVKGVFPDKLFKHRSPNETDKESEYIKKNYKQLTFPVFVDYLSTITRPMGDGNWSIDYQEDSAEYKTANKTFQQYVENEIPIFGSLENYVKFILPSIKSIDANGFVAVRPYEMPTVVNEEGIAVVDSSDLFRPTIYYFAFKDVVSYKDGEYYLFLSKEKSPVLYGQGTVNEGLVFELYTRNSIIRIIQQGKKVDFDFRDEEYYRHDLDHCQVEQLKGIPHLKEDMILWQSPFLYATDLLDLVATNGNWEQAMINKCVFPIPVMFGDPCDFADSEGNNCYDGIITNQEGERKTCPSCNGQGLKSRLGPLRTLLIRPTTKMEQGEEKSSLPPLQYISPDVTTLEFIHKKVESDTLKARAILKLRNKNTTVQVNAGDVTATEIVDDAKGMYAFVKPISDQIFGIYEFLLKAIGQQRYGEKFVMPVLSYPKTFDFKSPEDYLNDIKAATENNLPPSFVKIILMQYINAFYGDSEMVNRIFKLVDAADTLFGLSQDEINMKVAKGTAAKWQDILHYSILNYINDFIREDDKFMDKKIQDQVELLEAKAKEVQLEIEGKTVDNILGSLVPDGGGNPLASSVGGLTGMIDIVKAVSSGVYDLDAAVALVSQRFGISEEEARKQLGTPQVIQSAQQADKVATLT